jgi:hypothetical protein
MRNLQLSLGSREPAGLARGRRNAPTSGKGFDSNSSIVNTFRYVRVGAELQRGLGLGRCFDCDCSFHTPDVDVWTFIARTIRAMRGSAFTQ